MNTIEKILAYANLEIALNDPDAFDIESVTLKAVTIETFPRYEFFAIEHRNTEWNNDNYNMVYNTMDEATEAFKAILAKNHVEIVKVANDIYNYFEDDEPYTKSATYGDYSPSCPWNAPGMSVRDFI